MSNIYDIDQSELVEKAAEELKKIKEIEPPAWAAYVKTGMHKERPPIKQDWWYTRAAAILRYIYRVKLIGVSKLRTRYGGKKNKGHKPSHFYKGSGNIIRKILQQLEKAGFLKKTEKDVHKGREITPKGKSFLDKIATQIAGPRAKKPQQQVKEEKKVDKAVKKEAPKKPQAKKEAKPEGPLKPLKEAKDPSHILTFSPISKVIPADGLASV